MANEALEDEKLQLEINNLKLPWWRKTETWKTIVSSFVSLVFVGFSWFFAYHKGWLDIERSRLERDKSNLIFEINEFKTEKTVIASQNKKAQNDVKLVYIERDSIKKIVNSLNVSRKELLVQIAELKKNDKISKASLNEIISEASRDQTKLLYQIDSLRYMNRVIYDQLLIFQSLVGDPDRYKALIQENAKKMVLGYPGK